jgi:asparagine synthase (glutamine-hydrolysing)
MLGKNRGPEYSSLKYVSINLKFGFHRLAINGINQKSNQPLVRETVTLICNGEIYNYKELYKLLKIEPQSDSDCEVIIHLYKKFGINDTLKLLDGVFAFALLDNNGLDTKMYVARDPYGVRPLYMFQQDNFIGFGSSMTMLTGLTNAKIEHFKPGTYMKLTLPPTVSAIWKISETHTYHTFPFSQIGTRNDYDYESVFENIRSLLTKAVYKRCVTSDRPIACLLSGGLDSSLIAALVNKYHKEHNLPPLQTYCIGVEGSVDIKSAEMVANYLGTKHTSIIITENDFFNAIPEVIKNIESYDTTTVRASLGNYLVAKYISDNSEAKVIFSGEGSDELTGGYLYMNQAKDCIEFDLECKRLLSDIYLFDVTRSDKSISNHGLEPRVPFLDREFVQYYLSLPKELRYRTGELPKFDTYKFCEKFLLRKSFESTGLLPDEILWRTKEAFSDGVSSHKKSLFEMIQERVHIEDDEDKEECVHNKPKTTEQHYYRRIFETHFQGQSHIIPYFWMPRFVKAVDPSARTLNIYYDSNPELAERSL